MHELKTGKCMDPLNIQVKFLAAISGYGKSDKEATRYSFGVE